MRIYQLVSLTRKIDNVNGTDSVEIEYEYTSGGATIGAGIILPTPERISLSIEEDELLKLLEE